MLFKPKWLYTWAMQLAPTNTDWDKFAGAQLQSSPTKRTYKVHLQGAPTRRTYKAHLQMHYTVDMPIDFWTTREFIASQPDEPISFIRHIRALS